jgi:hypothetical protein
MKLEITSRAKEVQTRMQELNSELNDYNTIVMCIRALQAAEAEKTTPTPKLAYTKDEYEKVLMKLRRLCAKHELSLPDGDYIEWGSIEII